MKPTSIHLVFMTLALEAQSQILADRVTKDLYSEYYEEGITRPLISSFERALEHKLLGHLHDWELDQIMNGDSCTNRLIVVPPGAHYMRASSSGRIGFVWGSRLPTFIQRMVDEEEFDRIARMKLPPAFKLQDYIGEALNMQFKGVGAKDTSPPQHVPFYKKIGKQYKPKSWR